MIDGIGGYITSFFRDFSVGKCLADVLTFQLNFLTPNRTYGGRFSFENIKYLIYKGIPSLDYVIFYHFAI